MDSPILRRRALAPAPARAPPCAIGFVLRIRRAPMTFQDISGHFETRCTVHLRLHSHLPKSGPSEIRRDCRNVITKPQRAARKPKRHKVRLLESIAERVDVKYIAVCDSCPDKEHEFDSIEDRDAWISDHQSKVARGESGTGDHQHFSTREE